MTEPVKRKKRVVFRFDERSQMSWEEWEQVAKAEGWKWVEVETRRGKIRIPVAK